MNAKHRSVQIKSISPNERTRAFAPPAGAAPPVNAEPGSSGLARWPGRVWPGLAGSGRVRAEQDEQLGTRYLHDDVTVPGALGGLHGGFDVAACNFGRSDIDDLDAAITAISNTARPTPPRPPSAATTASRPGPGGAGM